MDLGKGLAMTEPLNCWVVVQISKIRCSGKCIRKHFEWCPQVSGLQEQQEQQQQEQQQALLHAGQMMQVGQVIQSGDVKLTIVPGDVKVIAAPAGQVVQGGYSTLR